MSVASDKAVRHRRQRKVRSSKDWWQISRHFARRIIRQVISIAGWLSRFGWKVLLYIINILCAGLRWLMRALLLGLTGIWQQLFSPLVCFVCVYASVLLTSTLPASVMLTFLMPTATMVGIGPLDGFPVAVIPAEDKLVGVLMTAALLAIKVFAMKAYQEWKESSLAFGARVIYACNAGVAWPKVWFRRKPLESPPYNRG